MANFVTYHYEEHIISAQNTAEQLFMAAFEEAKPALDEATVIVNPYLINPLSAIILFKTPSKVTATLTVHGRRNSREDIVHTFDATDSHVLPVVGLYNGIETKVSVALASGEKKEFMISAAPIPTEGVSSCQNIMTSMDYFGTDLMFLTPAGKQFPVAFDYKGDLRWLLNVNTMFDIKRLKNGNIITETHRYSRMPYCSTGLVEMTMVGKIIKEYRMPGNAHHDQWEMRDGNIMACTQDYSEGKNTVEDMLALLDRNTGKVLRTWDFKDFLPQNVGGSGSQDAHDWFHNNALWVDEDKKEIILSGRHQDAIACFNYEGNDGKGELKWIIGDPEGWPEDMQKYFFKPVGDLSKFDWQYEQHACIILPDGDIMAFDNGQYRSKIKENYRKNRDNFSRGVRYRIDTEKMEIEQVWQFGKEWGQDFFSPYICNVEYYADGHYLIHSGGIGYVDGYASDILAALASISDVKIEEVSKTVEEKDGVLMYYLEVNGNFYRAERLALYHNANNLPIGTKGQLIGELDITPEFGTVPQIDEVDEACPLSLKVEIIEEEDKFVLGGTFPRGSLAMWVIENDKESHGYYINTAAQEFFAMCSGAYLDSNAEARRLSLSKRGLSGKFEIKLIVDDKKYSTGIVFKA